MGRIFSWTSAIRSAMRRKKPVEFSTPVRTHERDSQSIPVSQCTIHAPGHRVTPSLGLNASKMTWQRVAMTELRGTRVRLSIGGENRFFWSHDTERLSVFLRKTDESVQGDSALPLLWSPSHNLLGVREGKSFYLVHLAERPLDYCSYNDSSPGSRESKARK